LESSVFSTNQSDLFIHRPNVCNTTANLVFFTLI
jgi:hypothetical protein